MCYIERTSTIARVTLIKRFNNSGETFGENNEICTLYNAKLETECANKRVCVCAALSSGLSTELALLSATVANAITTVLGYYVQRQIARHDTRDRCNCSTLMTLIDDDETTTERRWARRWVRLRSRVFRSTRTTALRMKRNDTGGKIIKTCTLSTIIAVDEHRSRLICSHVSQIRGASNKTHSYWVLLARFPNEHT